MENIINQFINKGVAIKEEYNQKLRDSSANGILDLTGQMPATMNEWMSSIKIYAKRHLSNHPLYDDIESILFHNKNSIKDYEKMMGLLRALYQDIALAGEDSDMKKVYLTRLPQNSEKLLTEIVDSDNPTQMLCERFEKCSFKEDEELRGILRELQEEGYIKIPQWADNMPYYVQVNNSARTYGENSLESSTIGLDNNLKKEKKYDVFISHANQDKNEYVNALYLAVKKLGINVFYDSDVLSWGDNWKNVILEGSGQSEFAIIVISESFFGREWTERELSEFLQRQNESNQKIVLPLLHNISFEQLKEKYPDLSYIQSIKSDNCTPDEITILLAKELIKRYKNNIII